LLGFGYAVLFKFFRCTFNMLLLANIFVQRRKQTTLNIFSGILFRIFYDFPIWKFESHSPLHC
jgi:hypothetical protein